MGWARARARARARPIKVYVQMRLLRWASCPHLMVKAHSQSSFNSHLQVEFGEGHFFIQSIFFSIAAFLCALFFFQRSHFYLNFSGVSLRS